MEINTQVNAGLETSHVIDLSDRLYKIILAIISLAAVYVVGQIVYEFQSLPQNTPREISVTGEGKTYAKPDIAMISFGVTAEAPKSQDAVNQSNEKMNAVIKVIKESGIQDQDIKTTYYNLSPVYGKNEVMPLQGARLYYPDPGESKITGYRIDQQIEVKIRSFDKINEILDKATSAGANTVGNLQFTVDDIEKVKSQAREKAIKQAKEKMASLVKDSGLRIDKIVNITEGYYNPIRYGVGGVEIADLKESVAPQIEPGQSEITANVTLTYRVK